MNPNYLSGYIHKHTGKTFKSLIQEQRMMLATRLLSNSDLPVTDIALQAGYENITFFTRNSVNSTDARRQNTGNNSNKTFPYKGFPCKITYSDKSYARKDISSK